MNGDLAPRVISAAHVPSITVIIPNRNDSRDLRRCIDSVLDQEIPPDEIIVVDDQSSDDSVSVIRSLIHDVPRAQLITSDVHLGTNGALNEGLRHTHGDYVLFLSANDFVLPGIFARAKSCLTREHPPGVWSAMAWLVDDNDHLIRLHPSAVVSLRDAWFSPEQCLKLARRHGNWFTGTTLIFHCKSLADIGGLDAAYGGLSDLLTALMVACRRGAVYTPEPLGAMRVHGGGFLSDTLANVAGFESIIERIYERGPRLDRRLFNQKFLNRLALRFRFAAVRASGGKAIPGFAARYTGFRRAALDLLSRCVPSRLPIMRVALAFLFLRPFDVLPTLWYRLGGAAVVRFRTWLRGNSCIISRRKFTSHQD